jgi:DNA-binding response OmpR family regulator
MNILIAEDEREMARVLSRYFEKEGFTVYLCHDGEEALNVFYANTFDVVVLDWMMPRLSGIDVCREIKELSDTKVLMLTAKSETEDELKALGTGADAYLRKPFDPRILIVRVKKLADYKEVIRHEEITINLKKAKIYKSGKDLNATNIEFQLLKLFLSNKNCIFGREQLLNKIWGYDYDGTERTVDTHIRRLRKKIGEEVITTHRGLGYCVED